MRTIERNYRKNPHTARLLLNFPRGGQGLPAEITPTAPATEGEDLLGLVPVESPAYRPSERQAAFMEDLIRDITALDAVTGGKARTYTDGMTENEKWTRENVSTWIDHMKAKRAELRRNAATAVPAPAPTTSIPNGRYGIKVDGEVKCYKVGNGKAGTQWEGFVFLDRISSDDLFPIRNQDEKDRILAAIGADIDAAAVLAALTLRQCLRCGRTLSDTKNPHFYRGLGPDCGDK